MNFVDEAKIFIKAGDGGNGICSFRKEKYVEFGGPDGGNGGDGGSIVFKVVSNLSTLVDFKRTQYFKASNGQNGQGKNKNGKSGKNLIINIPQGTQIVSGDKKYTLYSFYKLGKEEVIIKGGNYGLGNSNFKSSRNQAPRKITSGEIGNNMWVWLILKLSSNIGLLGMPNAGKSTFFSKVTSANPKIGDYPFTTLKPQLGTIYDKDSQCTIADIPGLIKNASLGYGLGIKFLKHLEGCKVLVHIIDITSNDVVHNYTVIRRELKNYKNLISKQEIVLLSKKDRVTKDAILIKKDELEKFINKKVIVYSSKINLDIKIIKQYFFHALLLYKT